MATDSNEVASMGSVTKKVKIYDVFRSSKAKSSAAAKAEEAEQSKKTCLCQEK